MFDEVEWFADDGGVVIGVVAATERIMIISSACSAGTAWQIPRDRRGVASRAWTTHGKPVARQNGEIARLPVKRYSNGATTLALEFKRPPSPGFGP
jgi:hypothetical protein